MNSASKRIVSWLIGGLVGLPLGGCGMVADIFAPGLAQEFGLDPASVKPLQGVVLVAFNNTTRSPATFYAFEAASAQDFSQSSGNFSVEVEAGEVRNEILDCPVAVISPGRLSNDFTPESIAASVGAGGSAATVNYTGPVLVSGSSFACGDLVEIRLSAAAAEEGEQYGVSVRVIKGR